MLRADAVSWRERAVVAVLVAATVAALVSLPRFAAPHGPVFAWDGPVQFSQGRAWADAVTFATQFPRRWSGGPDRRAAADWIMTRLMEMGQQVYRATFPAAIGPREPVTLENVWGISPGTDRPGEIVVAMGNYDMAPTSFQAASDTVGHVATILELARVMSAAPHHRTLVFFFPDAEEWGMLGAWHFARTFPDREKIRAVLSIEDLDPGGLHALGIDGIGQFRGFAPAWLRSLAASAASREGFPTEESGPLWEWLQRSVMVSATDQGPFLGVGIPAIDLAGHGADTALKDAVYHLPGDTIEKMHPGSLGAYGRIQERILRAIDAMPEVPRESDYYLRVGPDRIVRAPWLPLAQAAVFIPLAVTVFIRARRSRPLRQALAQEALSVGALVAAMMLVLGVVKLLPAAGLMPNYELHPATPRHPDLTTVRWPAVAVTALAAAAGGWIAARLIRRIRGSVPLRPGAAVAGLLAVLLLIAVIGLLDNPFATVTFLLLPALLWVWIEPRRSTLGRAGNALLVAMGFLVLVALFAQYAGYLRIGGYILWYVLMALAYGLFPLLRVVLAFAATAVGLRLIARASLRVASVGGSAP